MMEGRKVAESGVRKNAFSPCFSPSPCLPNPPPPVFIHASLSPSLALSSTLRLASSLVLPLDTHKKYPGNDVTEENDWSVYLTAGNLCFAGVLAGM